MKGGTYYYLDMQKHQMMQQQLQRNEITTFDSRLMKFGWDNTKSSFYSPKQFVINSAPYIEMNNHLFDGALMTVTYSLSTEVVQHKRSVFTMMNLVGEIGGIDKIFT